MMDYEYEDPAAADAEWRAKRTLKECQWKRRKKWTFLSHKKMRGL